MVAITVEMSLILLVKTYWTLSSVHTPLHGIQVYSQKLIIGGRSGVVDGISAHYTWLPGGSCHASDCGGNPSEKSDWGGGNGEEW